MLITTRFKLKDSFTGEDFASMNQYIDGAYIPSCESVPGIRSVQVYNSGQGDLIAIYDLENLGAWDSMLADPKVGAELVRGFEWWLLDDTDILYDRGVVQDFVGQ